MPKLELTYFNGPGRAEPVRVALFIAGLDFVDHRVDFPTFVALRGQGRFPLGSVPILEVDGLVMTQTGAMLRYVARLAGGELYPADPMQAFIVDSAIDTFNDTLSHALTPSMFERDMDKKLAMRKALAEGPMAQALSYVEGLAARSAGPFLTGTSLTIADLLVANQILQVRSGRLDGLGPETLAPYPRVNELTSAYDTHPSIQAYRAR